MTPKVSFSKLSSDTSAWFHAPQNWLLHLSGAMFKEAIAFEPLQVQLQGALSARL